MEGSFNFMEGSKWSVQAPGLAGWFEFVLFIESTRTCIFKVGLNVRGTGISLVKLVFKLFQSMLFHCVL